MGESDEAPFTVGVPIGLSLYTSDPAHDAQTLMALGAFVREFADLESRLRTVYCCLVDSKYAIISVAFQMAGTLIETCQALVEVHTDMSEEARVEGAALLKRAKELSIKRNRWIHGTWTTPFKGTYTVGQGQRNKHTKKYHPTTLPELLEAIGEAEALEDAFGRWLIDALGPDTMPRDVQLMWEQSMPKIFELLKPIVDALQGSGTTLRDFFKAD